MRGEGLGGRGGELRGKDRRPLDDIQKKCKAVQHNATPIRRNDRRCLLKSAGQIENKTWIMLMPSIPELCKVIRDGPDYIRLRVRGGVPLTRPHLQWDGFG